MAKVRTTSSTTSSRKIRPAMTPEAREQQLIARAYDLVEQRLIDGTASSQETTHFLKQATAKAKLEQEILELNKELVKAKTEAIKSQKQSEEMFAEAIKAFKSYSGQGRESEEENEQYY